MEYIRINEGRINIVFGICEDKRLKLLHFSSLPYDEKNILKIGEEVKKEDRDRVKELSDEIFEPVQLKISGFNSPFEKHGNKHILSSPGCYLKYAGMREENTEGKRKVIISLEDREIAGVLVEMALEFHRGISVVRIVNKVTNIGENSLTLEDISSFLYFGIEKEGEEAPEDKMHLLVPYNGWQKEMTIKDYSFADIGFCDTQPGVYQRTSMVYEISNTGNWSSKKYLPAGYIGNSSADSSLFFQIEHNGSWHYEIGDQNNHYYICISGPNETDGHWWKILKPGESFETVPVAAGVGRDDPEEAIGELTAYRRCIRRKNRDNEELPVIFNDYMNCLFGDPTTEKELPLIDAAQRAGCEYFVIDAGWYDKGSWWDSVGEWKESRERFPGGIREVTDRIREKGMIPGAWLELEVMGVENETAKKAPDDWFFLRHGKRVYDRSRLQLDFRNPEVIKRVTEVVDRVVNEYGISYIKMDYNIEPGIGTELNADSPGDGMLGHERAYLKWLEDIFEKYPDLVIENCSSGGMRIDYAMLSRYSIQSTSDQEDYRNYSTIAVNSSFGVCPEQAAVWSYPMLRENEDVEEVIYNMVNAMLLRIHQSGHLAKLKEASFSLVAEGIRCYKEIRGDIKKGLPFLPAGLADNRDRWLCFGLKLDDRAYLAVFKRDMQGKHDNRSLSTGEEREDENAYSISLSGLRAMGSALKVRQLYPAGKDLEVKAKTDGDVFTVTFEKPVMARLFEIRGE